MAFLLAAAALSHPAYAQQTSVSPAWTVIQVSGEVRVRPADPGQNQLSWQTLPQGARIDRASEIETGPDGRVSLTRGEDMIRIMPASRLAVPPRPASSVFTRIRVLVGKAFFDVDKRPGQEFEVQTPYLAAIVKGTSFSVSVTGQRSRVNVAEGRVGVTALDNGQSVVIGPGQSARVTTQPNSGVSTEPLAPGEFDDPAPTDGGTPATDTEQRGEVGDTPKGRDQAKADNPGRGGEEAQGRGRPDKASAPPGQGDQGRREQARGRDQGDTKSQSAGRSGSKPVVISKALGSIKLDASSATGGLVGAVPNKLSPSRTGENGGSGTASVYSVSVGTASTSGIASNGNANGNGNGNGNGKGNGK